MPIILQKAIVNRETTTHPSKATATAKTTAEAPAKIIAGTSNAIKKTVSKKEKK